MLSLGTTTPASPIAAAAAPAASAPVAATVEEPFAIHRQLMHVFHESIAASNTSVAFYTAGVIPNVLKRLPKFMVSPLQPITGRVALASLTPAGLDASTKPVADAKSKDRVKPLVSYDFPLPFVNSSANFTTISNIKSQVTQMAGYGFGSSYVYNRAVRESWMIAPNQVTVTEGEDRWTELLSDIRARVCAGLGIASTAGIRFNLYKLLVYEKGGHFNAHRDTELEPGMFATCVVQLPCTYTGGKLRLKHSSRTEQNDGASIDMSRDSESSIHFAAFYRDVLHELSIVESGIRVVMTFNVVRKPLYTPKPAAAAARAANSSPSASIPPPPATAAATAAVSPVIEYDAIDAKFYDELQAIALRWKADVEIAAAKAPKPNPEPADSGLVDAFGRAQPLRVVRPPAHDALDWRGKLKSLVTGGPAGASTVQPSPYVACYPPRQLFCMFSHRYGTHSLTDASKSLVEMNTRLCPTDLAITRLVLAFNAEYRRRARVLLHELVSGGGALRGMPNDLLSIIVQYSGLPINDGLLYADFVIVRMMTDRDEFIGRDATAAGGYNRFRAAESDETVTLRWVNTCPLSAVGVEPGPIATSNAATSATRVSSKRKKGTTSGGGSSGAKKLLATRRAIESVGLMRGDYGLFNLSGQTARDVWRDYGTHDGYAMSTGDDEAPDPQKSKEANEPDIEEPDSDTDVKVPAGAPGSGAGNNPLGLPTPLRKGSWTPDDDNDMTGTGSSAPEYWYRPACLFLRPN